MVSETERNLVSEDVSSEQEELSAAEAQVELSETEGAQQEPGAVQEPDAATVKAERDQFLRERDVARAIQAGVQRQLRAIEIAHQQEQAAARREIEEANEEELIRRLEEDPDAAEQVARDLRDRKKATQAAQEWARREYDAVMSTERFTTLSPQEKGYVDQVTRQKYGDGATIADLTHEMSAMAVWKASQPNAELAARAKAQDERIVALEAAQAGSNLRAAGGPPPSMDGGAGRGRLTPKSYAEKLKRGEVVSPEEIDAMTAAYLQ